MYTSIPTCFTIFLQCKCHIVTPLLIWIFASIPIDNCSDAFQCKRMRKRINCFKTFCFVSSYIGIKCIRLFELVFVYLTKYGLCRQLVRLTMVHHLCCEDIVVVVVVIVKRLVLFFLNLITFGSSR